MAAKPPVELLSHTLRDMRTLTDNDALLERALSSISTYHPYPTTFLPRVRKLKFREGNCCVQGCPVNDSFLTYKWVLLAKD